jgi:urease accessory protein
MRRQGDRRQSPSSPIFISETMLHASKLIPQARGLAAALVRRAASVELDWDSRQKSRFQIVDSQQRGVGVFLARGQVVRGGDVLVVDDGSLIRVVAAEQPVLVVRVGIDGQALDLLRAAYHLGNRHVALEVRADHLKLEADPVLADMLRQMQLDVSEANSAFEPESGAYSAAAGGNTAHGHGHAAPSHRHDHADHTEHVHGPDCDQGHSHEIASQPVHVHGPGCKHDH